MADTDRGPPPPGPGGDSRPGAEGGRARPARFSAAGVGSPLSMFSREMLSGPWPGAWLARREATGVSVTGLEECRRRQQQQQRCSSRFMGPMTEATQADHA
mmetsp:Transcript_65992/g.151149  ORF Transcript_65992/g.151149 Transcript_65992/m.151149 type:complete len:101 (+) Transcript_65992:1025-1327(+)